MFHVMLSWFLIGVAVTIGAIGLYGTLTQCAAIVAIGG
jgi:hypothetical protein